MDLFLELNYHSNQLPLHGIPLAIYFKNTSFTLVDSIGKKIKVVDQIIEDLEIKNVKSKIERACLSSMR